MSGIDSKFTLSPVAQFRNTYDWDFGTEESATVAIDEVCSLLQLFALPVFQSTDSVQRLMEASSQSLAEDLSTKICSALMERLSPEGFRMSEDGGFLWRRNGTLFVMVVPQVLGFGCFANVHLVLWSPLLEGIKDLPDSPPTDFSRVAFVELSENSIAHEAPGKLWFIGTPERLAKSVLEIENSLSSASVSEWLESCKDFEDLLSAIEPEMRSVVVRRLNEIDK